MSRYVVDASVAVQWFLPEADSERALRLLSDEHQLSGPDLLLPELGNALWKRVRRGEISSVKGKEILGIMARGSVAIHPSASLIDLAFEIGDGLGVTVYDGMYVALAAASGAVLVTADRKLLRALDRTPFDGVAISVEQVH